MTLSDIPSASSSTSGVRPVEAKLSSAQAGQRVRIVGIAQEADLAAWLRAVGMHEDAEVTVLRRAPFGGPMHLRTSDGGEFAIHRDLARCIHVADCAPGTDSPSVARQDGTGGRVA
jgi:ferrous iron transport protein A